MRGVRTLAAIAVVLALAPVAAAAKPRPPILPNGVQVIRVDTGAKPRQASCSEHSRENSKLGKATRKILPVACEQPPRVQLVGIGSITALLAP
jgi:hypothetical protein